MLKKYFVVLFFIAFVSGYLYSQAPNEIRYNGKLKEFGEVTNGIKTMKFSIYDKLSGGNLIYPSEEAKVDVKNGIFSHTLKPKISQEELATKELYLEIAIDDKILSPREKLTSVPYSLHSTSADNITSKTTEQDFSVNIGGMDYYLVPKGAIIIWSGSVKDIPSGWVLCDGSEEGIPDLRDRFVLGAGNNYAVGAKGGESEHTLTVDEMPNHSHDRGTMDITGQFPACVEQEELTNVNGAFYMSGLAYEAGGIGNTGNWLLNFKASKNWTGTSSYVGNSQPHNNMPPYYALCYIMRK